MGRFAWTVVAIVIASLALLMYGMHRYARFDMTSVSDDELADRYRLVCGAYADMPLDESRIPSEFAGLVPYAKKYGYPNDIIRKDCAEKMSIEDAKRFAKQFDLHKDAIDQWLRQFPGNFPADEIRAFRALKLFRYEISPVSTTNERTV